MQIHFISGPFRTKNTETLLEYQLKTFPNFISVIFDIFGVLVILISRSRIFAPPFSFRKTSFSGKSEMKNHYFHIKFCLQKRTRLCGHFGGANSI